MDRFTGRPPEDSPEPNGLVGFTGLPQQLSEAIGDHFTPDTAAFSGDPASRYLISDAGDALYLYSQAMGITPSGMGLFDREPIKPMHAAEWFPGKGTHGFPPPIMSRLFMDKEGRGICATFSTSFDSERLAENLIQITGDDMTLAGCGLLKAVQAGRATTYDNFREAIQARRCSMIYGKESRSMWEAIRPTAGQCINIEMSGRPLPNQNQYKVYAPKTVLGSFVVLQFAVGRTLQEDVDRVVYYAKLKADDIGRPRSWLRVRGEYALNASASSLSYQISKASPRAKSQPIALEPEARHKVYEAIDRHVYPENLHLIYDNY